MIFTFESATTSETIDFNVNESPVMVEAHPHPDGIALIVSKTPEKHDGRTDEPKRRHLSDLYSYILERSLSNDEQISIQNDMPIVIFSFGSMTDLIKACVICSEYYSDESSLYKMNDTYYLILNSSFDDLSAYVRSCLLEYGESYPTQNGKPGVLYEYGKSLIKDNAIQSLAKCK